MSTSTRVVGWVGLCKLLAWTAVGAAEPAPANTWSRFGDGPPGERTGAVLLFARDANRLLLLGGERKGAAPVQALDLASPQWSEFATQALQDPLHPYYQAAYHPKRKTVYCLSNGSILYSFHAEEKTWRALAPAPALEQLSWLTMACDPEGERLVVVGADKRVDHVGWTRTVVYDLAAGQWDVLPLPNEPTVKAHQDLVTLIEGTSELVGRIRLAWYRDPKGLGTDAERRALGDQCGRLAKLPGIAAFTADLGRIAEY